MIIFITGLPGSGKSTIGEKVATELGWDFYEADDALSDTMKEHISDGVLLTELELDEWLLKRIPDVFDTYIQNDKNLIVSGMSGDTRHKKILLEQFKDLKYVTLVVPFEVLKERVKKRNNFVGTNILKQCWEGKDDIYADGVGVDGEQSVDAVVSDCVALVRSFELVD